jgi:hypothetical protein
LLSHCLIKLISTLLHPKWPVNDFVFIKELNLLLGTGH